MIVKYRAWYPRLIDSIGHDIDLWSHIFFSDGFQFVHIIAYYHKAEKA